MRHDELAEVNCSIARTWSIVGERWTMLVLREFFRGEHRFDRIQRRLGIGRSLLTDRLAGLVEEGVLRRQRYDSEPERFEYHLTQQGEELYPILVSLMHWGDRWKIDTPPVRLRHRACGHEPTVELRCTECEQQLERRDLRAAFSPDAW